MLSSLLLGFCFATENQTTQASVPNPPKVTEIVQTEKGFELLYQGKPYTIKGAGAPIDRLEEIKRLGGNSVRTWGVDEKSGEFLDRARELGMTVTVGFWMRKEDGFNYRDQKMKDEQAEEFRKWVRMYKDHPAILMWAVGNEMELGTEWPEVWQQVERLAVIAKEEDPSRPVMTVVADMWPEKQAMMEKYIKSVDVLGINSYVGFPTIHNRLTWWKKPYVVTEFAFSLPDRDERRPWAGHIEPASEEKALSAVRNYRNSILAFPGRVLGSYYFYFNASNVGTSSMHSTHLRTGERLQIVEELAKLWGGDVPPNRAPVLRNVSPNAPFRLRPRATFEVAARGLDPDQDQVALTYEVLHNDPKKRFVGDFEQNLGLIEKGALKGRVRLTAPAERGLYRVLIVGRDGRGAAATHTISFAVE
ncbi:MAG: hypothetical protein MUC92_10300 [Fimbriimonadaceae bacterium]|jgi:hypothetical protein|nr:hypothetical protein [Fimbriimonadaceae bacterium]